MVVAVLVQLLLLLLCLIGRSCHRRLEVLLAWPDQRCRCRGHHQQSGRDTEQAELLRLCSSVQAKQ
jgi:hypothetical protein